MAFDEQYWRDVISGEADGVSARLLRPLLRGASWLYGGVAKGRRMMYERGLAKSRPADAPVISVGNLTTGGTGKTPLVAWVVRYLADRGLTPAILTRGYKAVAGESDEATMLQNATGAPVVVNPDRVAGAAEAIAAGADALVMDDGFQHVRLLRDLDIVTIDATCPFGYDAVLPRGMLREPITAAGWADVFVITRCDQADADELDRIERRLDALNPAAPVLRSRMKPLRLTCQDGRVEPVDTLAGEKVWAFCGLGNPEGFYRMVESVGAKVIGRTTFNDHHAYSEIDIQQVAGQARQRDVRLLVTTAKDAVKIAVMPAAVSLRVLEIDVDFPDGADTLENAIDKALGGAEHD